MKKKDPWSSSLSNYSDGSRIESRINFHFFKRYLHKEPLPSSNTSKRIPLKMTVNKLPSWPMTHYFTQFSKTPLILKVVKSKLLLSPRRKNGTNTVRGTLKINLLFGVRHFSLLISNQFKFHGIRHIKLLTLTGRNHKLSWKGLMIFCLKNMQKLDTFSNFLHIFLLVISFRLFW